MENSLRDRMRDRIHRGDEPSFAASAAAPPPPLPAPPNRRWVLLLGLAAVCVGVWYASKHLKLKSSTTQSPPPAATPATTPDDSTSSGDPLFYKFKE